MADVRAQVFLPFGSEFGEDSAFTSSESGTQALGTVFDQVVAWPQALRPLREH